MVEWEICLDSMFLVLIQPKQKTAAIFVALMWCRFALDNTSLVGQVTEVLVIYSLWSNINHLLLTIDVLFSSSNGNKYLGKQLTPFLYISRRVDKAKKSKDLQAVKKVTASCQHLCQRISVEGSALQWHLCWRRFWGNWCGGRLGKAHLGAKSDSSQNKIYCIAWITHS